MHKKCDFCNEESREEEMEEWLDNYYLCKKCFIEFDKEVKNRLRKQIY